MLATVAVLALASFAYQRRSSPARLETNAYDHPPAPGEPPQAAARTAHNAVTQRPRSIADNHKRLSVELDMFESHTGSSTEYLQVSSEGSTVSRNTNL